MKNLLRSIIAFAIISTCYNCTVESDENVLLEDTLITASTFNSNPPPCSNQDPQARITNNGTISVTLEIATLDGTILHTVADLAPGNVSGYNSSDSTPVLYRWADEPLYLSVSGAYCNRLNFDASTYGVGPYGFHGTLLDRLWSGSASAHADFYTEAIRGTANARELVNRPRHFWDNVFRKCWRSALL